MSINDILTQNNNIQMNGDFSSIPTVNTASTTPSGTVNTSNQILQKEAVEAQPLTYTGTVGIPDPKANPKGFATSLTNVMLEIMKLLVQSNSELMTNQRMGELTALETKLKAFDDKIEAMKDEKDANFKAAITQAALQIVGGAAQVGMSVAGGVLSLKGLKQGKIESPNATIDKNGGQFEGQATDLNPNNEFTTKGRMLTESAGGVSQISTGFGAIGSAYYQGEAKEAQIAQAQAEKTMQIAEKLEDSLNSMVKSLLQEINSVINSMSGMISATQQTEKQIAS